MALTISSVVVVLVSTVFLVQNRYYAIQTQRSTVQDVVRAVTELVAGQVRPAVRGAVTAARSDSLTIRTPMVVAGVCGTSSGTAYVQMEGGEAGLATDRVAGAAVFDVSNDRWVHYASSWAGLDGGTAGAASSCAANGADTVGARHEFHALSGLGALHGSVPPPGSLVMLFRETTFSFRPSDMETGTRGFFQAVSGSALVEYATGLDDSAGFQYRLLNGSSYQSDVPAGDVDQVAAVRVVARARGRVRAGGVDDVTFGWAVNVPLGNIW